MKLSVRNDTDWKAEYKIDNEYGLLECIFYPEQTTQHFYAFFSRLANEDDYSPRTVNPSFTQYVDHALGLFAKEFPGKLRELIEETIEEVKINTLISLKELTRKEATAAIKDAIKRTAKVKKKRMNSPGAGRPQGSVIVKTSGEWLKKLEQSNDERKRAIKEAIHKLYGQKNNMQLETKKAVAHELGITSKTLRNWIKEGGWTWDELVAKGTRGKINPA